jgi:signal transduction histidine kinase
MPLSRAKIRWGYFIALLLLLVSYSLIFITIDKQADATSYVAHSYTAINTLQSLKSEITDAETGARGFIITKDSAFLQPYHTGSHKVFTLYKELQSLERGKGVEEKVAALGGLIDRRVRSLHNTLELFVANGAISAQEINNSKLASRNSMDSIRMLVTDLQAEEYELIQGHEDKLNGFFASTKMIAITSLAIALITIFYSVLIYTREKKAKERAIAEARGKSVELEQRVNELHKVNSELQELKSIEKFASTGRIARTIAHEVRNPLTNISLASEQLKELTGQSEDALMFHDMISRNSNRINQLVSDLLSSTRFAQLEYSRASINQVLDESLDLAKDRLELNNIKVEKDYERGLEEIYVDPEKIRLAFLNLIVNAIEAMVKGEGILHIRTYKNNAGKCVVEVRDNGSGMEEETVQKLFEPYFTSKAKGNGLGLTNTQNIILNHRGTIQVSSKPGKGTTFSVVLNFGALPQGA